MVIDLQRGTRGELRSIGQLTLEELARSAETSGKGGLAELARAAERLAASPEAVARHEAIVREAATREARERYDTAARDARRMFPLRALHQDAIIKHCAPGRTAPVLERTEALASVARWPQQCEREGRVVLALIGKMGNGKTTAAMVAALRALSAGESVAYVKETTLIRWRKFVSLAPMLERAMSVSLLVVDELGGERKHVDEAREAILEIVDDRLGVGRTMLIGNVSKGEFSARYDARLIDRMREVGIVTECLSESMRGRGA